MLSKPTLQFRPATEADIDEMIRVQYSAWEDDTLIERMFPQSSAESIAHYQSALWKKLADPISELIVVEDLSPVPSSAAKDTITDKAAASAIEEARPENAPPPRMIAWSRWDRKVGPITSAPPPIFTPDDFPSDGDSAFAARFQNGIVDGTRRNIGGVDHFFLSLVMVRREWQRRGVGSMLVEPGVNKADEEGLPAYVNSSPNARGLYEKFGFVVVDETAYEGEGVTTYHMIRPAKGKGNKEAN